METTMKLATPIKIRLSERGGVANLQREISVQNDKLRLLERGELRLEREIPRSAAESILALVRMFLETRPRRTYGSVAGQSDSITLELDIDGRSGATKVRAVFDPSDPAPSEFWNLVSNLHALSRG